jgi:tetratricopeptide (TPR) repeat protein/DNA-binding CsgD family transcriptional regulator
MNRFTRLAIFSTLYLILFGCSHKSDELNSVEQIMETAPDSALYLLQRFNPSLLSARSDKAMYSLLMSQALDKNEIKEESDSLISIATKYYKEENPVHAGYAWFYSARCAYNRGDAKAQADALLKAQEYAEKTDNYKLRGLIYSDKGSIYAAQRQFDSCIISMKKAYNSFICIKDYRNSALCLITIGYKYLYAPNPEMSIRYYLQARKLSIHCKDSDLSSTIYRHLGIAYYQLGNYQQSLRCFYKIQLSNVPVYNYNKYYLLATVFVRTNEFDSARFYLNKVQKLFDMAPSYYQLWMNIYEKEGNMNKALYYSKKITESSDSLHKLNLDVSFAGLEKKYKYQGLQLSNQKLIIENKQNSILLLITLFALSLGAIVVLLWKSRVSNQQLKVQQQLLKHEKNLVEKEKENINLLEQQLKMQNILLLNVEQYRQQSIKRPDAQVGKRTGVSPILNKTFHEELIACMDIQYNDISKRLKNSFSDLTERDILICCLLLAGFDSGMIATILDIKNDSIRIHRTRLRKKLELLNSENLTDYLRQF